MKYSKEKTQEICKRLEEGDNNVDAALLCDISEDTFYEWMKKSEFSEPIKKAMLKCKSRNTKIIQKAGLTTWQASAWYLERKYPEEYALRNVLRHEGKNGEALTIKMVMYGNPAAA